MMRGQEAAEEAFWDRALQDEGIREQFYQELYEEIVKDGYSTRMKPPAICNCSSLISQKIKSRALRRQSAQSLLHDSFLRSRVVIFRSRCDESGQMGGLGRRRCEYNK
jgi:hypothetical protein